jgi:50S ribosomal subunit-associated GTPase HflX
MKPENKLFATLDVTYHGLSILNSNQSIIFADTIGFISDIPHNLIEAFKTSLADTLSADLYIHLIDVSHPDREAQEKTVMRILGELAPEKKLTSLFTVYNKCDKVDDLSEVMPTEKKPNSFFVSCKNGEGLDELRAAVENEIVKLLGYVELSLKIGQGSAEWFYLNKHAVIKSVREDHADGQFLIMSVLINKPNAIKFVKLFPLVEISK